jgi:hypothetical protein
MQHSQRTFMTSILPFQSSQKIVKLLNLRKCSLITTMDSVQEIETNISLAPSVPNGRYIKAIKVKTSYPFLTLVIFHRYETSFLLQYISP